MELIGIGKICIEWTLQQGVCLFSNEHPIYFFLTRSSSPRLQIFVTPESDFTVRIPPDIAGKYILLKRVRVRWSSFANEYIVLKEKVLIQTGGLEFYSRGMGCIDNIVMDETVRELRAIFCAIPNKNSSRTFSIGSIIDAKAIPDTLLCQGDAPAY